MTRICRFARTLELALPAELAHDQNIDLIRRFVQRTLMDEGMRTDVAFHDKGDGNPHVHIMLIMRAIQVNTKFYDLRSKRRKNADLSTDLAVRISTYEDRKNYQRYYSAWSKLTGIKRSTFKERYEFELRKYREAGDILKRWEADSERIDYKGWREALKYLNKERFLLNYELRDERGCARAGGGETRIYQGKQAGKI